MRKFFRSTSDILDIESRLGGLAQLMVTHRAGPELSAILASLAHEFDQLLAEGLTDELEQTVRQLKARVAVAQARVAAVRREREGVPRSASGTLQASVNPPLGGGLHLH